VWDYSKIGKNVIGTERRGWNNIFEALNNQPKATTGFTMRFSMGCLISSMKVVGIPSTSPQAIVTCNTHSTRCTSR
jgi:hypothetical protein